MADYIYLLENRLSPSQQSALLQLRELTRNKAVTLFLVGGAVRDLTSGSPVRDLDVVVQGNALKLRKDLEKLGAVVTGELDSAYTLFTSFPGAVRVEVGSTLSVTYPKPGKPVAKLGSIQDDLRRRDFTANAMALSLNDGSYGLLMDPLNGVADIENRQLRLVSNYGFIEEPVRMIRAARFMARLGWQMEEKTQARYETGKQEDYIAHLSDFHRGYETEEIFHEEDPLRVLLRLEAEGWMAHLAPVLSSSKANTAELDRLRETQMQLQVQGIHPNTAAANYPYLTAKLAPKDLSALKQAFPNQHFAAEIDSLETRAREFSSLLSSKAAAAPSQFWKLLYSTPPELVLWVAHTTRSSSLQARFKSFYTEWPQTRQKLPISLMQEMRITPQLPEYNELLEKLFFELMDGKLTSVEELKAFLEPYSPPAPPPPVNLRRARPAKKEARPAKSRKKAAAAEGDDETELLAGIAEAPLDVAPAESDPATAKPSTSQKPSADSAAAEKKVATAEKSVAVRGNKQVPAPKTPSVNAKGKTPTVPQAASSAKPRPAEKAKSGKAGTKSHKPAPRPAAKATVKSAKQKPAVKASLAKKQPAKKNGKPAPPPQKKQAAKHAPAKTVAKKPAAKPAPAKPSSGKVARSAKPVAAKSKTTARKKR